MLDPVVPDRIPLGKLTAQTPNTFSSSVLLWTGLRPTADFVTAHTAPVLWEVARALGYRTGYVSSQNPDYEDFGTFTRNAGIDVLVTGNDIGGMAQEQLGAPDERAIDEALRFVRGSQGKPFFLVVHLSNTHMPYRVDPALLPFTPQSPDPLGDVHAFHNRYLDAVRLQERTLVPLLAGLRALPTWDDTAVLFVSDHGEQFREHGGLYHNHSLFDEEVRVPGWIAAGPHVLDAQQRAGLALNAPRRTYTQDVHETVMDLFGVEDARASLPDADQVTGHSLLRAQMGEPVALLATSTSVWEPDDARYGVMRGERLLFGGPTGNWWCFDIAHDPNERFPKAADACGDLLQVARTEFGGVATPR
jgi:membrane-anchored protein YejM (alkaline phosphatase superfamily)